jgi:hypothetical protein
VTPQPEICARCGETRTPSVIEVRLGSLGTRKVTSYSACACVRRTQAFLAQPVVPFAPGAPVDAARSSSQTPQASRRRRRVAGDSPQEELTL